MQDTVNFKSIAGICKIQASIKIIYDITYPGFRVRKSIIYLWAGEGFRAYLKARIQQKSHFNF